MSALKNNAVIGVIGAGAMGAGIAQVAAAAGHPVRLFDAAEGAAERGLANIANGLEKQVARGKMQAADRDALLARIEPVGALGDLAPAALLVEAIVERLDVKQQVFAELESICAEDAILASNTSSLSITAIGAALTRPQRLVGMHFFNPAPVMKLVEVISGLATDAAVAETVFATATNWGKLAVHARSTPGFIVNRVARPFYAEALRLLQEGAADAATIDALLREAGGFRMGSFELMDLIGHDVNYAVTHSVFEAFHFDPRFKPSLIQKELLDGGFLGRKSGRGFFDYREGAEKPAAQTAEACTAPREVLLFGDPGIAAPLVDALRNAGIAVNSAPENDDGLLLSVGSARIALTDGRTATERCAEGTSDLVLLDLALDFATCPRVALAVADQADPAALDDAIGLMQAIGKRVSVIDDAPGMIVLRTVAMLANEGADAVHQRVCSAAAVDTAMRYGVNYPRGPMNWADEIGPDRVLEVLDNLAVHYGDGRYRASPLLQRVVAREGSFIESGEEQ